MRIRDLKENVNDFFDYAEERDRMFNPEANHFADINKERYKQGTGVTFVPPEKPEDPDFSNKPAEDQEEASAGYKGLQSIRKLAGLSYDESVLNDPPSKDNTFR